MSDPNALNFLLALEKRLEALEKWANEHSVGDDLRVPFYKFQHPVLEEEK